jgi:hypothetical protein
VNPAARERERKAARPADYCPNPRCLWRVAHVDGCVTPCPRHQGSIGPALDARIEGHGSVILVAPLTDGARDWLEENTDGTWFGGALAVEPRYVLNLVAAMREHGFTVEAA